MKKNYAVTMALLLTGALLIIIGYYFSPGSIYAPAYTESEKISKMMLYMCSYGPGLCFVISLILFAILKVDWDDNGETLARVVLSAYITNAVIFFLLALIKKEFLTTSLFMLASMTLYIIVLWRESRKKGFTTYVKRFFSKDYPEEESLSE